MLTDRKQTRKRDRIVYYSLKQIRIKQIVRRATVLVKSEAKREREVQGGTKSRDEREARRKKKRARGRKKSY
jgi:hypothetical protein